MSQQITISVDPPVFALAVQICMVRAGYSIVLEKDGVLSIWQARALDQQTPALPATLLATPPPGGSPEVAPSPHGESMGNTGGEWPPAAA